MTYRLISKERDYYDAMFHAYGFDPKKVWNRKTEIVEISNDECTKIMETLRDSDQRSRFSYPYDGLWVGVAGSFFRGRVPKRTFPSTPPILYPSYNHQNVKYEDYYDAPRNKYTKKVDITVPRIIKNDELFHAWGVPILVLDLYNKQVIKNPILQEYNFSVVLSSFEIFTEVEQYMESVLAEYKEPLQTSDEDRIISAGFDTKQSFRHRK